ncbi:178_t:CDS:2 [Gigaspora margarita]|uniref:178_t:CDS:1 n=1 Tax=Gigaspora margarita TaxID=4874 RepID=A0ABN7UM73_GIGMA|nr:178_t:CDS:2 [Gigaspora margarita]
MPNALSQYTSSSPTTSHDISTWNSNNNSQKYYHQHREKVSSIDIQSQHDSYSQANSYNKTTNTDSEELNFSDEEALNEVNTPELFNKETITNLHTFNKDMIALAKDFLVKNSDPTKENIEQFIAGKVWQQKLSKYLDANNFSEFKKSSSSLKSLENFLLKV